MNKTNKIKHADAKDHCESSRMSEIITKSLVSAILLGIVGISLIRGNVVALFPPPKNAPSKGIAKRWLQAVRSGNEGEALSLAAMITNDDLPQAPRADYIRLMLQNQLGTGLLTSPFTHFDYIRWENAILAQKILKECSLGDQKLTLQEKIFRTLIDKLKIKTKSNKTNKLESYSLTNAWNLGAASGAEWFRLYTEVVFQSGCDVMIVTLFDEKHHPVHAVCELREANGVKSVADPLKNRFWKGVDVANLAADDSSLDTAWSSAERSALKRRAYRLPAEPMDYRLFEQRLSKAVVSMGAHAKIRFGVDPEGRIDHYLEISADKKDLERFSYWHFPFSSLKSTKAFPEKWRAPRITTEKFGSGK